MNQPSVKIKICGLTNLSDAQLAVSLGADALGFIVFADSPRQISLKQATHICQQLPPFVTKVALVVNADKSSIEHIILSHCFNLIQFHGNESALFCQQFQFPYIRCLRLKPNSDILLMAQPYLSSAKAILLDKWHETAYGGQGELIENAQLGKIDMPLPMILAGGLNAQNVRERISHYSPYAVDVSSGVEQSVGKKSAVKMQAFIQNVQTPQ